MIPQPPSGLPSTKHKTRQVWTPAEDSLLARAVAKEKPQNGPISWCSVAAHLPGRNNKDCRKRWHYSIAHSIRKGTWTREEDQRLRDAVAIHGTRWSKIANLVGTRNGDQCWKRWYDCLDPKIDKSPWTAEEDMKLLRTVAKHGRNWTGIVNKHFPNRTSLSAKNRYSILQRKQDLGGGSDASAHERQLSLRHDRSPSRSITSHPEYRGFTPPTVPSTPSGSSNMEAPYDLLRATELEHQHHSQLSAPDCWSPTSANATIFHSAASTPDPTPIAAQVVDTMDWSSAWTNMSSSDPSLASFDSTPYTASQQQQSFDFAGGDGGDFFGQMNTNSAEVAGHQHLQPASYLSMYVGANSMASPSATMTAGYRYMIRPSYQTW